MVRTRSCSTKLALDIKPHTMSLRPRNKAGFAVTLVPLYLMNTSTSRAAKATGRTSAGSKVKSEVFVDTPHIVKEEVMDSLSWTTIPTTPVFTTGSSSTVSTAPSSTSSTMSSSPFTSGSLVDTAAVIRRANHASLLANETYSKLVDQARHLEVANAVLTGEARGHQESFNRLLNTKFPGRRRK
ncbi:hypothetical protein BDN72DRAFT_903679 [Pluteus cervinus]|uniref:Uncharacterized protein n=1 Tax=Pluteus cervinus TaxID=181527 RepID=A0ACD3A8A3_9AGAR|nr:hypothetical protein BDN72DRAFT_903679 [Pluteus cervinus]